MNSHQSSSHSRTMQTTTPRATVVENRPDIRIDPRNQLADVAILTNPFIRWILYIFIEIPLRELYFHGPSMHGYGFWKGLSNSQICAELTQVEESHWVTNISTCNSLVHRQFEAFLIIIYFCIYGIVMVSLIYNFISCCYHRNFNKYKRHKYKQ